MKKIFSSLPFRLILGIAVGIICGLVFPESVMKVIVTLQYIMGQLITFCVPLIIIGFIAPSITKLGANASRLLGVAVIIAYVSSICAKSGKDTKHIAIYSRVFLSICDGAYGPGCVAAYSRKLCKTFIILRHHSVISGYDDLCCFLQIANSVVISQTFPKL